MIQNRDIIRPNIAVASDAGTVIDLHIGHARQLHIYGPGEDGCIRRIDVRAAPEPRGGDSRWMQLAEILNDCFALLASGAGTNPVRILEELGVDVFIAEGSIKRPLEILFAYKARKSEGNSAINNTNSSIQTSGPIFNEAP